MSNTTVKKETLTFKRVATKAKDGANGFLYIHSWGTGYQELIFESKGSAESAARKLNTPEYVNSLKLPA